MSENVKWETWSMPQFNPTTKKWFFRHEDADGGKLIRVHEYPSEADALAAHKNLFINRVMGEQGLRAVD